MSLSYLSLLNTTFVEADFVLVTDIIANSVTVSSLTPNAAVITDAGSTLASTSLNNGQILIGTTGSAPSAQNITGTANQVNVTNGPGSITLSLPQSINTTNSPTFTGLTLSAPLITSSTVDGRDVSVDGATLDNLNTTIGLGGLTTAEVNQLKNIDLNTISNTQWGYLSALDQSVSTTSDVTFDEVTCGSFHQTGTSSSLVNTTLSIVSGSGFTNLWNITRIPDDDSTSFLQWWKKVGPLTYSVTMGILNTSRDTFYINADVDSNKIQSRIGGTNKFEVAASTNTSVNPLTISPASNQLVLGTTTFTSTGSSNTLTFPTSTDTLVGRNTTDTLTNKTLSAPTINGATLSVDDTGSAFNLSITSLSNAALTANRTLTFDVNNSDRTIDIGGNITTASSFTTSGANTLTLTTTGATNCTLPTTGVLSTLAGSETFSNKSFSNATNFTAATSQLVLSGPTRTLTLSAVQPAGSSRTVTFQDPGTNTDVVYTDLTQTLAGSKSFSAVTSFTNSSDAISTSTGCIILTGGLGCAKNGRFGGDELSVKKSSSGAQVDLVCQNTNTNANSRAAVTIGVNGGSAGDPALVYDISGVQNWTVGVDNDQSDRFAIAASNALGTTDVMRISTGGLITLPLNCRFSAYKSATSTDVTGDGTVYTIIFDTEIFDVGSNYNNSTGVFTAPVTGVYQFNIAVIITGNGTITNGSLKLVTSARTYQNQYGINVACYQLSTLADMNGSDTASVTITITDSSGKVDDVNGGVQMNTFFNGYLVG